MTQVNEKCSEQLIQIVRNAAKATILPHFRQLSSQDIDTKSHASDLVTIADKASENYIGNAVNELFQNVTIIGEEAVSANPQLLDKISTSELSVIIDPIDGTWNYARGLPLFGVIVSVIEEGKTVFGLHYDPITDAWITALAGSGTYFQNQQGQQRRLLLGNSNSIATGIAPLYLYPRVIQEKLAMTFLDFERVMSFRCACHEYWLMAEGHVDFSMTGQLNPWDHAAGELLYREAGGYAAMLETSLPYHAGLQQGTLLLARNQACWETLQQRFAFVLEES